MSAITADIPHRPETVEGPRAGVRILSGERCLRQWRNPWADLATQSSDVSMFQHPQWCEVVERVFGHRPRHLLAVRDGRLVGVLPLMEVNSLLAGRMLVSVPYATGGGAIADRDDVSHALAAAAERLCRERGACVVDVRSAGRRFAGWRDDDRYVGFSRDLPPSPADIEPFLPRKARAAARQAETRDGLCVRHDAAELLAAWRLYTRSMRRLGTISYPWRFFDELRTAYGEQLWVTSVWQGSRPVSAVVSFVDRETVRPYFAGADERVRSTGCTNLMYRELMRRAAVAGLRRFDFGRTRRQNVGALEFKRHQGFEPLPLGYQRFAPDGRGVPDLTPGNSRFAFAQRLWPLLPLTFTRSMGGLLARWIPG
jgi:FemAB-related protein (PEP-CTERM system-associated)